MTQYGVIGGVLLCFCLSWSHHATASDFTAEYWQPSPAHATCPTQFTPLAAPRFVPTTDPKGKSVVRSDAYRETATGGRFFTGNVKVQRDDLLLTAPSLEWLEEGPLQFDEGLALYHDLAALGIESATIDLESTKQSAKLQDFSLVLFDFPLQASLESLEADNTKFLASRLKLSGCDPRYERWGFRIKRIKINRESDWVTVRGVAFYVGKLPVFYLPFFAFKPPTETDGLSTTRVSYRSDNGLIISQPFTFFGAKNELELSPRYLLKNGLQLRAQAKLPTITAMVDWLPEDRRFDDVPEATIDPERWRVLVNHQRQWRHIDTEIDFTQTSDFAYQHDFEFDSLTQPQYATNNTAALRHTSRDWDLALTSQRFNSTSADRLLGERFPEFDMRWHPRWRAFSATTNVNFASYRDPALKSHRRHVEQAIQTDLRAAWGDLGIGLARASTRFDIDDGDISRTHTRAIDTFHIAAGTYFDKFTSSQRLTIEPRLFYIDRTFTDAPLTTPFDQAERVLQTPHIFGENRISGLDNIPGEHRLSTGFRFASTSRTQPSHKVKSEFARVVHFDGIQGHGERDRGWAASLGVQTTRGLTIAHRQFRSEEAPDANEFATLLLYEPTATKAVYASIGKRSRDFMHQAEVGFRWPMSARWEMIGAYGFNPESKEITDTHLGLGFTGCCYRTMLFVQRAIDWDYDLGQYRIDLDNRVMLSFQLGGLGAIGRNRIESLVERKRFGFR